MYQRGEDTHAERKQQDFAISPKSCLLSKNFEIHGQANLPQRILDNLPDGGGVQVFLVEEGNRARG
jgi:hypothetical protein